MWERPTLTNQGRYAFALKSGYLLLNITHASFPGGLSLKTA